MGEELDDADIPDAYLDSLGYEALLQHAMQIANAVPGRNDECNCGSGKKYKRCCGGVDESTSSSPSTAQAEVKDIPATDPEYDRLVRVCQDTDGDEAAG
jgi:hypothetical protein